MNKSLVLWFIFLGGLLGLSAQEVQQFRTVNIASLSFIGERQVLSIKSNYPGTVLLKDNNAQLRAVLEANQRKPLTWVVIAEERVNGDKTVLIIRRLCEVYDGENKAGRKLYPVIVQP